MEDEWDSALKHLDELYFARMLGPLATIEPGVIATGLQQINLGHWLFLRPTVLPKETIPPPTRGLSEAYRSALLSLPLLSKTVCLTVTCGVVKVNKTVTVHESLLKTQ